MIKAQYNQDTTNGDYQLFTMRAGPPTTDGVAIS